MILLGTTPLISAIPPKRNFLKVEFNGESYLDNMHCLNKEVAQNEYIENIWGINTVFLAKFQDTLEAGNLTNNDTPITSWRIKRKKTTDSLFKLITEISLEDNISSYIDYTPRNLIEYEYAVYPVTNGTEGNPIIGVSYVDFFGWILSTDDGATSFKFDMEVDTDSISSIVDFHKFETYAKYPVISKGQTKYQQGKIACMPYEVIDNNYEISLNVLESLEEFINSSQPKILRNSKGQIWKVETTNFSYKYLDKIESQPYSISFDWIEIGSAE